jgi:type III restriction enzyme
MARLELLDFQQSAANALVQGALNYFLTGPDKIAGRLIPYVGQLKAVTGAGKTPILAHTVGKMTPAIVLWTTKFGAVVDQTVTNLGVGGKYHHLLGSGPIEVIDFSSVGPATWHHILERKDGLTIFVSTVAAWNSSERDERLNVHKISPDWGNTSRWDQLRTDRNRPLWIVYDEAHNTTTEQIEQLDALDPAGFFVASASPIGGKLQFYLSQLPEDARKHRIVPVSTREVVDNHLIKSTLSLVDYHGSTEEMLSDVVKRRDELAKQLAAAAVPVTPKAIYVVEKSNANEKGADSRPIAIWKHLVNSCNVDPATIAVCTKTKELPKDAVRIDRLEQLTDSFKHIIFNKKLQEGWDDPSVYLCYFDGTTESATRIEQVVGRAMRQPNATHYPDEDLNKATFFLNCPSEKVETIIDDLKESLRIYKDDDEPNDFEPFQINVERQIPPKIPLKPEWVGKLTVPNLQLELPSGDPLRSHVGKRTLEFGDGDLAAPGKAVVNIVSVRTGEVTQGTRNLLEDMRVRCGTFLQEQIRSQSKNCVSAMHPNIFGDKKLERSACYGSKALEHYKTVATEVVRLYENRVRLEEMVDPDHRHYTVGPYQPSGTVEKTFTHAGHPHYDAKSFKGQELDVAKAMDKLEYVWVRNKDRVGYGVPLPVKCGSSSTFYPDFLWWVKNTIWAIDPTGKFILEDKVRYKLLETPAPLKIALLTPDKYDQNFKKVEDGGWTLLRHRIGNAQPELFDTLDELLQELAGES